MCVLKILNILKKKKKKLQTYIDEWAIKAIIQPKKKKKKIPQGKSTKIVLNNEWTNNNSDKYMCIYSHTY